MDLDPVCLERLDPDPACFERSGSGQYQTGSETLVTSIWSLMFVGWFGGRSILYNFPERQVTLSSLLSDHLFHLETRRSHLMTFVSWTARPLSRFISTTTIRNTKLNIEYKYKIVWCVCAPACARVCVCLGVYHAAIWDTKLIKLIISCCSQIVLLCRFSVSTWVQLNDHTWL